MARLGRILGPALPAVATLGAMGEDGAGVDALAPVAVALFERLTEDEIESLAKELLATASVDGRELLREFDLTMQGRILTVIKLCGFAIEVNYADFFDAFRGRAAAPVVSH